MSIQTCLTGPPTVEHVTQATLAENDSARAIADRIPLGVLTLAAVLEREAIPCRVLDLNRAFLDHVQAQPKRKDFVTFAVDYLDAFEFDVLGLGTMCSSYPATLQIAAAIKARRPGALVMLGGPQASVVDAATLDRFPSVDVIVRGEADHSLVHLLTALEQGHDLASVQGITFRKEGAPVRNPPAPLIQPLDHLPLPAFHLLANLDEIRILPLELGRGCPFSCTFCSTNDFFRRRFRLKKPESVIEQMRSLNGCYAVKDFTLMHDMFTVDRKRVVEFCEAMRVSGASFEWSCSARTDSVDDELLSLMADSGCRGIFFGIETGSQRMQTIIDKGLDVGRAFSMVAASDSRGMKTTVSTIIGFSEEERGDLEATMNFVMNSARLDNVEPQVGILAPLAGTPILHQYRNQLSFDPLLADFSYTSLFENYNQFEMIKAHPDIFPNFFALPTNIPRAYLFELKLFFHSAFHHCRWLLLAAHQSLRGVMRVFEHWLLHRHAPADPVWYYISPKFKEDFICFLDAVDTEDAGNNEVLRILVAAYKILIDQRPRRSSKAANNFHRRHNPILCDNVEIRTLPGNIEAAIAALKANVALTAEKPVKHLLRRVGDTSELLPLNDSIAAMLELCDGSHPADDVIRLATGVRMQAHALSELFSQLSETGIVIPPPARPRPRCPSFFPSSCSDHQKPERNPAMQRPGKSSVSSEST